MTSSRVIELERRIPGPPEAVFPYFTDGELHLLWSGTSVELDPRPGGSYVVKFGAHGQIRGEYVEVDPPRRLVLLWGWLDGGDTRMSAIAPSSTRVEIEFIAEGAETLVRLRHSGIPDGDAGELVVWGWTTYLDRIGAAARGEARAPDPFATLGAAAID